MNNSLAPTESARSYFRRLLKTPLVVGIPWLDGRDSEIIELYGASGTGKSEVLMHAAISWASPIAVGGGQRRAVIFDNEFRLSLHRLQDIVNTRFSQQDIRNQTLDRIAIVRCQTSLEFLAALELISSRHGDHTKEENQSMLFLIDSLAAFFWREDRPSAQGLGPPSLTPAIIRSIAKIVREDKALVLAAKPIIFKSKLLKEAHQQTNTFSSSDTHTNHLSIEEDNNNDLIYPDCLISHEPSDDSKTIRVKKKPKLLNHSHYSTAIDTQHQEYMPIEWTKLVARRIELREHNLLHCPRFQARIIDLRTPQSEPNFWSFSISESGCGDWLHHSSLAK